LYSSWSRSYWGSFVTERRQWTVWLTISVTAYTSALAQLTGALGTAIPTVAIAALGIAAGLILLSIGVRVVKRFAKG
jgi:small neutral amino acid transporter SnatA (MarC family)